jgi:NAD(P)-dependent dehydrogenase (short-subunit alcohol dehydrogenase family)
MHANRAVTRFLLEAESHAPLEVCIFNIGANVNFPLLETTDRVFRKVWEMACWAGFITGREAARIRVPRERGAIFFTGATAGLRGGVGYAAFASAKFALRGMAQAVARKLGPKPIHVAHLVIDAGVDTAFVHQKLDEPCRDRPGSTEIWIRYPHRAKQPPELIVGREILFRLVRFEVTMGHSAGRFSVRSRSRCVATLPSRPADPTMPQLHSGR